MYHKTEPDLSVKEVPKESKGFMEKTKIDRVKEEDFGKLTKELQRSRSNAFFSFGVCSVITYIYLIFKDENDRDIIANLKMLRNEESICMDTIAKMIISQPNKDSLMFRKRLRDIREEIEMNEKKLEGLDLPTK